MFVVIICTPQVHRYYFVYLRIKFNRNTSETSNSISFKFDGMCEVAVSQSIYFYD